MTQGKFLCDSEGFAFLVAGSGEDARAVYATRTGPLPSSQRPATAREVKAFLAARAAWLSKVEEGWAAMLRRDRATDVGVDTLLRAAELHDDDKGPMSHYLRRALWRQQWKAARREKKRAGAPLASVAEPGRDDERFSESVLRDEVQSILARLDEHDRLVLELRFLHGMSYEDIADVLDCCKGQVCKLVHRALDNAAVAAAGRR